MVAPSNINFIINRFEFELNKEIKALDGQKEGSLRDSHIKKVILYYKETRMKSIKSTKPPP